MEFELILAPETPDKYLLKAEKPLSGLAFVEEASKCLRRSLDTKTRMRHITLGNVAQYTISVPQSIAIECGYFNNASRVYLPCEENVLKDYVFHAATMAHGASNRPCYPYYQDEIVLTSYIDELAMCGDSVDIHRRCASIWMIWRIFLWLMKQQTCLVLPLVIWCSMMF